MSSKKSTKKSQQMLLRELYPYWSDAHEELIEKLEILDNRQWEDKVSHAEAGSIRQMILQAIKHERHWIGEIAQAQKIDSVSTGQLQNGTEIVSELKATRASTLRYLGTLSPESLRTVRTAPGDPSVNEMERNVSLAWIFWNVMQFELITSGKVQVRLAK